MYLHKQRAAAGAVGALYCCLLAGSDLLDEQGLNWCTVINAIMRTKRYSIGAATRTSEQPAAFYPLLAITRACTHMCTVHRYVRVNPASLSIAGTNELTELC